MFDSFVIVDWSAANQPKTGRDSIWICAVDRDGAERLVANPPTRHAAKHLLRELLSESAAHGEQMLLGFDFPFGYPAGFARRLGLNGGVPPWRAVWDEIAASLEDGENNANNRFEIAAEFNRRVSERAFPFWGCPVGFGHDFLGPKHHNGHAADGLAEKRLIDRWMVGAQPCWKLAYTGSVGSQSLTGIPIVRALRDDRRWADVARIWPFETGLAEPGDAQIVFAEVWPSWWRRDIRPEFGPPNDKAQVRTVARIFAEQNRTGGLTEWFAGDPELTPEQRRQVETEEAWTLGVTGRREGKKAPSVPKANKARDAASAACVLRDAPSARLSMTGVVDGIQKARHPEEAAKRPSRRTHCADPVNRRGTRNLGRPGEGHRYLRDPEAIYRRSFELIRNEADLRRFPPSLRPLALRLAHAAGDVSILGDLAWSRGAAQAGRRALAGGAPVIVDSAMVMAGISQDRLPAENLVLCTLHEPAVVDLAAKQKTTRSAAAVELWRPRLAGAIVAIGNAPTALFRLLEILAEGVEKPALVLGFPVGFVGAAEAKEALIGFGGGLPHITLRGRRGGSALAAAAVNALSLGGGG